ncbi:MAG: ABC transporter permease [Lachnospiraceae bacterium]|nr:ABC transporter permease [Lachnospiraceae bacterium]
MKIRVYRELIKLSVREFVIYRMTATLTVLFGLMFYGIELLAGVVYYQFTDSIMGMTRNDYMILITTANIIQMGYELLFVTSHERLEDAIIEGELDYALIRPVNSFFYYAFQRIDIASGVGLLVSVAFLCFFLRGTALTGIRVAGYIVGLFLGIWMLFLVNHNIVMLSFWVEKSSKIAGIPEYLFELASRPRGIYPSILVWILSYILPFFTAIHCPIEMLSNKGSVMGVAYYLLFLVIVSAITYLLWNKGLKKYASAS